MDDADLRTNLERAARLVDLGHHAAAIALLRRVLAIDPEHAIGHLLLAQCLLATKRIHAARHEAGLALALAPELPDAHVVMASCALAFQKLGAARHHAEQALALEPETPGALLVLAHVADRTQQHAERERLLTRARDIDPENTTVIVAQAQARFDQRDFEGAAGLVGEALALDPESVDAHVMAGRLALVQGDTAIAREHALGALQAAPGDAGALALLTAVKARQSPLLGLWWRLMTWIGIGGILRATALLLGLYVLYRLTEITLDLQGYDQARNWVHLGWLGLVVYTWVAPSLFARALKKELEGVKLRGDF